jgi:hypothetical protein
MPGDIGAGERLHSALPALGYEHPSGRGRDADILSVDNPLKGRALVVSISTLAERPSTNSKRMGST